MKRLMFFLMAACLFSCSDPKSEENNQQIGSLLDRKAILTHLIDAVIVPAYELYQVELDSLSIAVNQFANTPSDSSLTNLRRVWEKSYLAWQEVELFDFGPGASTSIVYYCNIYPVNENEVNFNINNPSVNLELPQNYDSQGYPALDYLINGLASSNEEILTFYTTDADASNRIAYLKRLVSTMQGLLTRVINGYQGESREKMINNSGTSIGSTFSDMVNGYIRSYEVNVRSGKIGIPASSFNGGNGVPEKVEAFYKKDISKKLALAAHYAAIRFFNGQSLSASSTNLGFASYLDQIGGISSGNNQKLSVAINEQMELITNKLTGLNDSFYQQVINDNASMNATFIEMQKLVKFLKIDMSSAMSIAITYTDNDGD